MEMASKKPGKATQMVKHIQSIKLNVVKKR